MPDQKPSMVGSSFVLAVLDVARTAEWWINEMGFAHWMEPEGWRFVHRDACHIMLGECPDAIAPADLGDHQYFAYIYLDDLDAYYREIKDRSVDIIAAPEDKPWGMREMAVRTPDGHRVMFGQDLDG
ncbi:MAG: VOC family protein [Proteobacteria bacterium]|nr:VOC family protein [Pseudomonadota bacterium]MDA1324606.1 VOC family protein [Pseudomonadota bacterium]